MIQETFIDGVQEIGFGKGVIRVNLGSLSATERDDKGNPTLETNHRLLMTMENMAYSDFTLKQVKKTFGLYEKTMPLFSGQGTIETSRWLQDALANAVRLASSTSSRSPENRVKSSLFRDCISSNIGATINSDLAFSLDAAKEKGLKGECDFIFCKDPMSSTIQSPIFALVEAKKNDIKDRCL